MTRYRTKYAPRHPLAAVGGYVYVHRAVLYEQLGPGDHPCHWCGVTLSWVGGAEQLHTDHVDNNTHNNAPSNLVPSCRSCNIKRTPTRPREYLSKWVPAEPGFMDVRQVAERGGSTIDSVRKAAHTGRLVGGRLLPAPWGGYRRVWSDADVEEWLRTRRGRGRPRKSAANPPSPTTAPLVTTDYYTAEEVAAMAGVTANNIRRLHVNGVMPRGESMPAPHGGRRLMFPRDAIDEWIPTRRRRGRPRKVPHRRADFYPDA